MSAPADTPEAVRTEIARAFRELKPHMLEHAHQDADLNPASLLDELGERDLEQFLNAYEGMFMEALEGTGHETRTFILETALPPILAMGQTTLDMIRSNVVSAVMLTHRMLPLIAEEHRDEAARWLARYHSEYTYELARRGLTIEAGDG